MSNSHSTTNGPVMEDSIVIQLGNGSGDGERKETKLRPYDIICGRCSKAFNHVGNRRFRVTIGLNLRRYVESPTRREKSAVIQSVVDVLIREAGARFLKRSNNEKGVYIVLDIKQVRQKVQHALRDAAAFKLWDEDDETDQSDAVKKQQQEEEENRKEKRLREEDRSSHNREVPSYNYEDEAALMEYAPFLEEERMLIPKSFRPPSPPWKTTIDDGGGGPRPVIEPLIHLEERKSKDVEYDGADGIEKPADPSPDHFFKDSLSLDTAEVSFIHLHKRSMHQCTAPIVGDG